MEICKETITKNCLVTSAFPSYNIIFSNSK